METGHDLRLTFRHVKGCAIGFGKTGKEIDFISVIDKKIIPIEVKNKKELSKHDLKNMKYFMGKYKISEGFVVYKGKEEEIATKNGVIKFIPLWKWLLLNVNK